MRSDNKTGVSRSDNAAYLREWRKRHPGKASEYVHTYIGKNREVVAERSKKYWAAHRWLKKKHDQTFRRNHRQDMQESYRRLRQEVLQAYGGRCACCGERQVQFLSIDHIDGNGAAHRREIFGGGGPSRGSGGATCRWLKRNGYPEGFQVLCHNCNCAKGFYGACPHQAIDSLVTGV